MIRKSNKFDKADWTEMLRMFKLESDVEFLRALENPDWWSQLFDTINSGLGIIFIEPGKGLIMGMIVPSLWCNKTFGLHELAWYVKPEYRKSTVGYRLFNEFVKYGNQLKDDGRVTYLVLGKLHNSPSLNYGKYGFKKMEETWIKDLS